MVGVLLGTFIRAISVWLFFLLGAFIRATSEWFVFYRGLLLERSQYGGFLTGGFY